MDIRTPNDVVTSLRDIRGQSEKGLAFLAEKERAFVLAELEADRVEALAFLEAVGTVSDRQAMAKLKSLDARTAAELAKVEVNRVKLKLKHLSEAQMSVQTSARMIELEWKTS